MTDERSIKKVFDALQPVLNERSRRLVAAAQAQALGRGGVAVVARAAGVARSTITLGIQELTVAPSALSGEHRVRRPGGGRKPLTEHDPTLLRDLEALVEPSSRGDPESPLRWTCKSLSKLAEALGKRGHRISARKVGDLLRELDYSLQSNRKTKEGASHPDRNAQFEHINAQALAFQQRGQPVLSVDTKKKELVGEFKNSGREWQPKGQSELVQVHDFPSQALGKAIPYGVYDVGANQGWVSVGTDHDTAEFAVATVRWWWQQMGSPKYPDAIELLIMADGGGSNGSRSRLWKVALQQFADETGLRVSVCHFSPWHEQMEQDRASNVLAYHPELARPTVDQSRSRSQSDRQHHEPGWAADPSGLGFDSLPNQEAGLGRGTREGPGPSRQLSQRMELLDPS